ncbi:hypothetical protein ACFSQT_34040, partial [Mesorhizobium calcicola]
MASAMRMTARSVGGAPFRGAAVVRPPASTGHALTTGSDVYIYFRCIHLLFPLRVGPRRFLWRDKMFLFFIYFFLTEQFFLFGPPRPRR